MPASESRHFGVMQIDADERIVGFQEKPADPRDDARRRPSTSWPRWASTCSRPGSCSSSCAWTPRGPAAATISATTSFPPMIDTHRVFAFPFRDENRKQRRLLARRRHAGRLLRGEHGSDLGRSAVEHVRRALADPHVPAQLPAAEVRVRRRRARTPAAARRSTASSARVRSSPAARVERSILGANTRDQQLRARARIRSSSTASTSAATPACAGRSSTRAYTSRRAPRSATTTNTIGPAGFTVSEGGVVVIAKADGVDHFMQAPVAHR